MQLLLIHTGGTIGMVPGPQGLQPAPGVVEAAVSARLPPGVGLVIHAFDPLIDSADIRPAQWNRILDLIEAHPDARVIVTHGTDTMAFTGAALTQALAGTGRRVVLCGSMQPLESPGGEAEGNLDLALAAALAPGGNGVSLAFAGRLLPAAGLVKRDSHAADAFESLPQPSCPAPRLRRFDMRRVAILTLSPGLDAGFLAAALGALDGAVLRVFGAGTTMADPAILATLSAATSAGKPLRAVSQCTTGGLEPGAYAAGAGLWAAGVENGGVETPEAALIRLWLR